MKDILGGQEIDKENIYQMQIRASIAKIIFCFLVVYFCIAVF